MPRAGDRAGQQTHQAVLPVDPEPDGGVGIAAGGVDQVGPNRVWVELEFDVRGMQNLPDGGVEFRAVDRELRDRLHPDGC